jgi:hypothetical protein
MYIIANGAKTPLPESENMAIFVVDSKDKRLKLFLYSSSEIYAILAYLQNVNYIQDIFYLQ